MYRTTFSGQEWRRDNPDPRDFGMDHPCCASTFDGSHGARDLPKHVTLEKHFSGVRSYCESISSVARACVDVVEYFERRAFGRMDCLSPLFLQHCSTRLLGLRSTDKGLDFRSTLKSLARFGLTQEHQWPVDSNPDAPPDVIVHGIASQYMGMAYVRIDQPNASGVQTLELVRLALDRQLPVLFGVSIPSSISNNAEIQFRPTFDSFPHGCGLVAVGYDDEKLGASKGAIRVRTHWGSSWGDEGYGWLPYAFVAQQLVVDCWILVRPDWNTRISRASEAV